MNKKDHHVQSVVGLSGVWVSIAHTFFASAAFLCALVVGMSLHFNKIVQNEFYGYPQEWFPSVSATIGDRYPERSVFQVLIAVTSGPRFALVLLWYFISSRSGTIGPKLTAFVGLLRTFSCGGWVYVTSTDDHDFHDVVMIAYVVLTLPWTVGVIKYTPYNKQGNRYRKLFATLFFGTLPVLVRYFIRHKIHRVPGAYTTYAFLEWSLIVYDIAFDSASIFDFKDVKFQVVNESEVVQSIVPPRPKSSNQLSFNIIYFLFEVLTWFIFWSVLTSVALTIWHFPLWGMGITGYESALFATAAPLFLAIPQLRKVFARFPQLSLLGLLIGVLSYKADTPETKLIGVGIGAAFGMCHLALQFWNSVSRPQLTLYKSTAFSLGLLASMVAKYSFFANNPIWPIINEDLGGWNIWALVGGLFSALLARREQNVQNEPQYSAGKRGSVLLAGSSVGALLYALHTMSSDAGTIISWGWDGFHMPGPQPIPYGAVTIVAAVLGIIIGLYCNRWSVCIVGYFLGGIGALELVYLKGWYSFCGGLILVAYLNAITPILLSSSSLYPPARVFGIAGLMYSVLVLGQVWTVAYAFVPGGPVLRERLDWVFAFTYTLIGLGVFQAYRTRHLVAPSHKKLTVPINVRKVRKYTGASLVALLVATAAATYVRTPKKPFQPYHPEDKVVTAGIWTVHFGLDNDMWASETRLEDVLKDLEVDIVGLLETDTQTSIGGHRDITQRLAYDLGMYVDYGPGPNKHTWGAALLSRFPIINSTHHLLPSPVGELAPAIHATLDVYGTPLDVVVFHSGQEEDELDRQLQAEYLAELMGTSDNPLILLSYLVVTPLEGNYNTYVSDVSRMKDIDPSDWDRWCEYILYRGIHRVGYARVSRSTITDTELQVGKFVLDGKTSSNTIVPESEVPESWRFPDIFLGEGVRGHFYHVFDEPRYYQ